ncbi:MAG TPA: PEPxxWA-CTERM sorting domain-containing protein [Phenylobacterium sp.]|jgi:hypothetical protein
MNLTSALLKTAALTAGLAVLGVAGQAAASTEIKIEKTAMDESYTATLTNNTTHAHETAYANGVTFTVQNWDPTITNSHHQVVGGTVGSVYTLYGFCVDIYHDISIGNQSLIYNDNENLATGPVADPLPNNFAPGTTPTSVDINATQLHALTNLIDTGYELHASETGQTSAYINNVEMQLAAIQAAIWQVENTGDTITVNNGTHTTGATSYGGAISGAGLTYQQYFNDYVSGSYTSLADANDSFYTIVQASPNYDQHQAFAIGWPIPGVPEPATWAMMLIGFGGLGALLRAKRRQAVLAV